MQMQDQAIENEEAGIYNDMMDPLDAEGIQIAEMEEIEQADYAVHGLDE